MSMFYVDLIATNPKDEQKKTPPVQAVVDTGSELSWMPKQLLLDIGVAPRGTYQIEVANGEIVNRDYGYAILSAEGFNTSDEIIFAEDSDATLLGVRTIEGFCVIADNVGHRFIPRPSLSISARPL